MIHFILQFSLYQQNVKNSHRSIENNSKHNEWNTNKLNKHEFNIYSFIHSFIGICVVIFPIAIYYYEHKYIRFRVKMTIYKGIIICVLIRNNQNSWHTFFLILHIKILLPSMSWFLLENWFLRIKTQCMVEVNTELILFFLRCYINNLSWHIWGNMTHYVFL